MKNFILLCASFCFLFCHFCSAQATNYSYEYDELGRLITWNDPKNGARAFDYDEMGNRKSVTVSSVSVSIASSSAVSRASSSRASVSSTPPSSAANRAPVANTDFVNLGALYTTYTINVLANDYDLDGDMLTIVSHTQPGGIAHVTTNGTTLSITGTFGPSSDKFTYTITDGNGNQATATVNVKVL